MVAGTLGVLLGGWRFLTITTGSMRPTLEPGDVIVVAPEPVGSLRRGQIVAFHPPGYPHLTVTHRVAELRHTAKGVVIRTKGDANDTVDPWTARIVGSTVWTERVDVPDVGYLAVWAHRPAVRIAVATVVVGLVLSLLATDVLRPRRRRSGGPARGPEPR